MASKMKESEGIALLSMYGDEDDDYDMNEDTHTDYRNSDNDTVPLENKKRNETVNMEEDNDVQKEMEMDPLDKFLPPPPTTKCCRELQEKIDTFLWEERNTGRRFNSEVLKRKGYRNPDFLLHAVTYHNIDQIGSCFSKEVFDPHDYEKSDYYDEIEADLKRELRRKEQAADAAALISAGTVYTAFARV